MGHHHQPLLPLQWCLHQKRPTQPAVTRQHRRTPAGRERHPRGSGSTLVLNALATTCLGPQDRISRPPGRWGFLVDDVHVPGSSPASLLAVAGLTRRVSRFPAVSDHGEADPSHLDAGAGNASPALPRGSRAGGSRISSMVVIAGSPRQSAPRPQRQRRGRRRSPPNPAPHVAGNVATRPRLPCPRRHRTAAHPQLAVQNQMDKKPLAVCLWPRRTRRIGSGQVIAQSTG
jgi:hypothetical protein